jgi:hypothetical protein
MDRYLGQVLKNWAAQEQAPRQARSRLLLLASARFYPQAEPAQLDYEENYSLTHDFYSPIDSEFAHSLDQIWAFHLRISGLRMA